MAKLPIGQVVIRAVENKTKKVCVNLPPALADKLRLASVGLGLEQGDLVAVGLEIVLKTVEVRVRLIPSAESAGTADVGGSGDSLRIASAG